MQEVRNRIGEAVGRVVIGQERVVDALLTGLSVGGHILLEGPPGVAKTLLAHSFALATGLEFQRIQFTPDMLPSDITGTMSLRGGDLVFRPGPVFANVVLADEINRTPPKTQAALLEAMQERHVTVDTEVHMLPDPFVVVATQNPIEYEGTYPLPEAQLDRFLMKVQVGYPSEADEISLIGIPRDGLRDSRLDEIKPVTSPEALRAIRDLVAATTVTPEVIAYAVRIIRTTRELPAVQLGASPRASVHLVAAARVVARLADRDFVTPDDIAGVAPDVLRHRLLLRPEAELDRYRTEDAIGAALASVPIPK
jgi:MoxR-like ATPase